MSLLIGSGPTARPKSTRIVQKHASSGFKPSPPPARLTVQIRANSILPATLSGWLVLLILDNDQRDAHLLYFTIYLLHSSTCFEHCMLIIMWLNCIDATSGIVLSVIGRPVHRLGENSVPSQPVHRTATYWEDNTRCCISTIQPPDD